GGTRGEAEMVRSGCSAGYGMAGAALRFTNVYGPGMKAKDSFVPRLMRAARDGHGVQVYGDGGQIRDLVHVDDVVTGILQACRAGHRGPRSPGAAESGGVNDCCTADGAVAGAPIPPESTPAKSGEMPAVIVDISAARALGYRPAHDLKSGLATVCPEFAPPAAGQGAAQ